MTTAPRPRKPNEKLAILMPGLGAVSTTAIAGIELVRRGLSVPIGSLTQLGTARLGSRMLNRTVPLRELLPLTSLDHLVFGAWDIVDEDAATVAVRSGVLSAEHIGAVRPFLESIRPRPGSHNPDSVRRIKANHQIQKPHLRDHIDQLRTDIGDFKRALDATRAVMIYTASTEAYRVPGPATESLEALEAALD